MLSAASPTLGSWLNFFEQPVEVQRDAGNQMESSLAHHTQPGLIESIGHRLRRGDMVVADALELTTPRQ